MIVSDVEQGSELWDNLRAGKLTASEFKIVLGSADYKRVKVIGLEPEEGFGRAKAQEAAFLELVKAGDAGMIKSDVEASGGLAGLLGKGLIEETVDDSGCSLKRGAAQKHIDLLVAQTRFTQAELGAFTGNDATDRGHFLEGASLVEFEHETGIGVKPVGFIMREGFNLVGGSPDGLTDDGGLIETKSPMPQNHLTILRKGYMPSEYKHQVHGLMALSGLPHCWFQSYHPELPTFRVKVERSAFTDNLLKCLHEFEELYLEQLGSYGIPTGEGTE